MKPTTKAVPPATSAPGPQFVGYFWPVIEALEHLGGSARPAEVRERVVKNLGVSEDVQTEVTTNGRARFDNQVAGEKLVAMLEDLELGLSPIKAYRLDPEFFHEFNRS